jgi:alkylhydroperoxidase family enzyme
MADDPSLARRRSVDPGGDLGFPPLSSALATTLSTVPRSARWVLPTLAAAFHGGDVSTLEPKLRTLVLLRVASVDRAPYWREQHEASAAAVGVTQDEVALVTSDEWETAPVFTDRERAAILWADRTARRLARRDAAAYRAVREHLSERELVELTATVSLACMANRLTNALRISPERPTGLSPGGPSMDESLARWSREMFDRLPVDAAHVAGTSDG